MGVGRCPCRQSIIDSPPAVHAYVKHHMRVYTEPFNISPYDSFVSVCYKAVLDDVHNAHNRSFSCARAVLVLNGKQCLEIKSFQRLRIQCHSTYVLFISQISHVHVYNLSMSNHPLLNPVVPLAKEV